MTERFDIAVIGGGMAGASLAAELAPHASVIILEAEDQPGYHATGRSAAFWSETYGGPWVQPLTTASYGFLAAPPPDFANHGFLTPRGALHIADAEGAAELDRLLADFAETDVALRSLDRAALTALAPMLKAEWQNAVLEPSCADIDVAALHAAYLRTARKHGASVATDARVMGLTRQSGAWRIETRAEAFTAGLLVNAAGAWADEVAMLAGVAPLGLRPYRRTMIQLIVDPAATAMMPLVIDARERFYFKAEAGGRLWLSPHDEIPCAPGDSAPEELDVAIAIDRLEQATEWTIARVERRWAGLRTFAPDRRPVYGFDAQVPGFFWCAGQGGFGIQTAPAAARLAAALVLGRSADQSVWIDGALYSPARFDAR